MSETLVVTLTLTTLVSILALIVGGMVGWMARQHSYETTPQIVYTHPEMFDEKGFYNGYVLTELANVIHVLNKIEMMSISANL